MKDRKTERKTGREGNIKRLKHRHTDRDRERQRATKTHRQRQRLTFRNVEIESRDPDDIETNRDPPAYISYLITINV